MDGVSDLSRIKDYSSQNRVLAATRDSEEDKFAKFRDIDIIPKKHLEEPPKPSQDLEFKVDRHFNALPISNANNSSSPLTSLSVMLLLGAIALGGYQLKDSDLDLNENLPRKAVNWIGNRISDVVIYTLDNYLEKKKPTMSISQDLPKYN